MIARTAKISLNLFLKNVLLLAKPRITMKLDLSEAVKGVAAKNKIIIKKIPHPNSEDEKLITSLISLWFI